MKKRERKLTAWHQQQVRELEWVAGTLARRETNKKHLGNATEYEDLKQVAFWGICAAVYDWNPKGGKAISSYAWDRAFAYIGHYMRDRSRLIKVPRDIQKLYYNYCEIRNKNPNNTPADVLDALDCNEKDLEEAKRVGVSTPFQLFTDTLVPMTDVEEEQKVSDIMMRAIKHIAATLNDAQMDLCMRYLKGDVKKQSDKTRARTIMYNLKEDLENLGFTIEDLDE